MIRNKFVYAGIGIAFGLLLGILGFWRTFLILVLGAIGFLVGWYLERQ